MSSLGQRAADTLLKQAADARAKAAAPKWLKMRRSGQLSDAGLGTVTRAMAPGTFRTSGTLGRGQMNLAQRVYGNMPVNTKVPLTDIPAAGVNTVRGAPHYAGEMVRKLPTRIQPDIAEDFMPVNAVTNALNTRYGTPGVAPPLTPYAHIGERGAFQIPAGRRKVPMPDVLADNLDDLHPGNTTRLSPYSEQPLEAFDFGWKHKTMSDLSARDSIPNVADVTAVSPKQQFRRPHIDPYGADESMGEPYRSLFGNKAYERAGGPAVSNVLAKQAPQQNDVVNKYWALPASQRAAYAAELEASTAARLAERSALISREGDKIYAQRDAALSQRAKAEAARRQEWMLPPVGPPVWPPKLLLRREAAQRPIDSSWPDFSSLSPAVPMGRPQPVPAAYSASPAVPMGQPKPVWQRPQPFDSVWYAGASPAVPMGRPQPVPAAYSASPAVPMGRPQPVPAEPGGILGRIRRYFMGAPKPVAPPEPQTSMGIL